MTTGAITSDIMVGGGIIGGIFALIFSKLFAYLGMQIVTITLIIVGLCMFTGFSISEFIKNRVEFIKTEKVKTKENKQDKDGKELSKEEELEPRGKVKISNGNEIPEEPDKQIIKNIDELKKTQPVENKEEQPQQEEVKKEEAVINHNYELPPISLLNPLIESSATIIYFLIIPHLPLVLLVCPFLVVRHIIVVSLLRHNLTCVIAVLLDNPLRYVHLTELLPFSAPFLCFQVVHNIKLVALAISLDFFTVFSRITRIKFI